MVETGARPNVPAGRRRLLRAISAFTSPLLPDDYLELINPLWSTRELRGRIERIDHETPDAATVLIKPGYEWTGHEPGQYLRIGLDINGVRHWRAYSITSEPERPDGCISVTPKLVEAGKVSPHLVRHARPGQIVSLGGVEGTFVLPDPLPAKLLFITAGSGITPVISMLRSIVRRRKLGDAVHLHSAKATDEVIFGPELRDLARRWPGFRLHEQMTATDGRIEPRDLDRLCPDWHDRETFVCGPAEMLDAMSDHWDQAGRGDHLHMERFQPVIGADIEPGTGGTIRFCASGCDAESDGTKPILVAGEDAGLELPYGCREGICHTCVGKLRSGQVRDLRNGSVSGNAGETVRTCINAPEGPVEIDL